MENNEPPEVLDEEDYEVSGFADENDTPVSEEEAALLMPGILRGLEAVAAGRVCPAADVFRDLEIKYGLRVGDDRQDSEN